MGRVSGRREGMAVDGLKHWFALEHDLSYDLPYQIERFREKFGKEPAVLWTKDGQAAPEEFALAAKVDGKLGTKEMYLE